MLPGLVLLKVVWSGGHRLLQMEQVQQSELVGLMIPLNLGMTDHSLMFWVQRHGLRRGKVVLIRVRRQ